MREELKDILAIVVATLGILGLGIAFITIQELRDTLCIFC